ncbi:hypothetical protein [Microbispora hainanensis]|uniref:Uncharacterized protein n=1 Tax=Microbispora hainanensis TaxID=568844 RepID=A0A544Z546_9ACTN|nr:hypothetical protein [Microbispora hainanensis]TQS24163.1 hypothetical protein FLX08_00130 [Microbispora hainanensis]
MIEGGRANAVQGRSATGRFNQSLNGAIAPAFVMGRSQGPITKTHSLKLQAAFCGSQPTACTMEQNMPVHEKD